MQLLQILDRSTANGLTFADPVKNPSAFPATIDVTVLLMSSIPLSFFWVPSFYGTWFQQLLCHSTGLMIETLCPISTFNQQLANLEQTQFRCALHCERWTVKGKDCASASHSLKETTYRTEEETKQLLRLMIWVIIVTPQQFRRFWWNVLKPKCIYLFQLLDFCCSLVQYLSFWKISFFLLFLFRDTPIGSRSRNLFEYIAEIHPSLSRRWTPSSATTL